MADPGLVPEQGAAVDDRDRDLFLTAGAGTGKTSVLVQRFCDAVCDDDGGDAGIGSVLAFTFTERAAGELKRRIRAELGRRAEAEEARGAAEQARRLRSRARESDSAWISTIHSFCRRLLASHPLAAGLDPGFRVLDQAEAGRVAARAFDLAWRRFAERGGDERFEMAAAFRVGTLGKVIRTAHDELRSRGLDRPALPAVEAPDVAAASAELNAAAHAALAETEQEAGKQPVAKRRDQMAAAAAGTERAPPGDEEVAGWAFDSSAKALQGPAVERYRKARAQLERCLVEVRYAHHYEHLRELLELYAQCYDELKEQRSALDFEDLQLRARRLLCDHPDVRERFVRRFGHLMVDEFQDTNALQADIVRLLHELDGAAANRLFTVGDELQSIYGFRHADVGVFRSQRARAAGAPDEAAGVRRLSGNFRSDPGILALVNRVGRELFPESYEELTVGKPPEDGPSDPCAEVLLCERKGWDEDAVAAEVSADEQAQPWRVAEARALAQRLAELRAGGVPRGDMVVLLRSFGYVEAYAGALEEAGLAPQVIGGHGYWSTQQVTDVRNLLGCVANPLDDRALIGVLASPACAVSSDTLWLLRRAAGRQPVWSALRFLFGQEAGEGDSGEREQVADGSDDSDQAANAPADPDRAVAREAWRERARECAQHVPAEDAGSLRELTATLIELRDEAPRHSLESLVDRVVTTTGYDLALLMRRRGRRRLANVRKLMRLARRFEADAGRDLRAFLDFTAQETEEDGREAEAAIDAEGHDGVRVMTVHAAKGLEFPVVAVADLGRGVTAGFPPTLRFEPEAGPIADGDRLPDDPAGEAGSQALRVGLRLARLGQKTLPIFEHVELQEAAVEREREEERRILHVAMTRAERRLILSGAFELAKLGDERRGTDPLIAPVMRALAWDGQAGVLELEPPPLRPGLEGSVGGTRVAIRVRTPQDAAEMAASPVAEPGRPDAEPAIGFPDVSEPVAAGAQPPVRAVSYSALALYERCGYRFYAERVVGMRPRPPAPTDAPAGSATSVVAADANGSPEEPPRAIDEWHTDDGDEALATRYARGRAVHELLERSAREGWTRPQPSHAAALLRREGADAGEAQVRRALELAEGFLASPLRAEAAAAEAVHPEAPFAFRAAGLLVRGEIDLLADLGDEILVVDYKTDALRGDEPADRLDRYDVQRRIYALAALRRYGRPVRVAYVFLERPDAPVEQRFEPEDVQGLAGELETMAAGIVAGRFEVTDSPERPLCLDCPARERLCVHGYELTMRDPAAA